MAKGYSPKERPELSEEQKLIINRDFESMELPELVKRVWADESCTLKEIRGITVREYIADISGVQSTYTANYTPKPKVELTPEQEGFIMQNMGSMKAIELTSVIFGTGKPDGWRPSFNSKEYKAVTDFIQAKAPDAMEQGEIPVEETIFKPPQSIMVLVGWANRFLPTGDPNRSMYTVKNGGLKPQDENNLRTLMANMKTVRFILQASQYEKMNERDLFVSTFMQFCHDKPDLAQEEVHQYIQCASEVVNIMQIEKYIQRLCGAIEEDVIDSATGEKKKRPSLAVIEMMNKSRANLEDAKERLKKLLAALVGSRATRMENKIQKNQSILPLLDAWRNEERRNELIAIAEKEKVDGAKEYERLKTFEDVLALVCGLTKEEAFE